MRVTILGANSLLGQHLIKQLQSESENDIEITTWCFHKELKKKIEEIDTNLMHYVGMKNLGNAVKHANIVINLHEYQDLTIIPDSHLLTVHNVEFVRSLVFLLNASGRRSQGLIHLSSCFVQCGTSLPNVYEAEMPAEKFVNSRPFEEYCHSKVIAEDIIKESNIDNFIIRPTPMYGPGDESSIITDFIALSKWFECIPDVGDHQSATQFAFVGNVAVAVTLAIRELYSSIPNKLSNISMDSNDSEFSDESMDEYNSSNISLQNDDESKSIHEIFLIGDDNVPRNIYDSHSQLICSGKRPLSQTHIPFLPLYYLYIIFTTIICLLIKFIDMPKVLKELPEPYFFYNYLHQWTYFNTFKSKHYLKYSNKYSLKEAMEQSCRYYRRLSCESVQHFSWKPKLS